MTSKSETLETMPVVGYWPVPPEWPLYVSVERAAEIAGVRYEVMKQWVDRVSDPMPHILIGKKKKLVRVSAIPEYMQRRETR